MVVDGWVGHREVPQGCLCGVRTRRCCDTEESRSGGSAEVGRRGLSQGAACRAAFVGREEVRLHSVAAAGPGWQRAKQGY